MNIKIPIQSQHNDVTKKIKVSEELDKRYGDVCKLCLERHRILYGNTNVTTCAYRAFDNEYCPDIAYAESKRVKEPEISQHFGLYLEKLKSNDGSAYNYILHHAFEFSVSELISIIRAFDFLISPYLSNNPNLGETGFTPKKSYEAVCKLILNEFKESHSEGGFGVSMNETLKDIERKYKRK